MKESPNANRLTIVLLFIYVFTLIWIIVFKMGMGWSYMNGPRNYNLIPYHEPLIVNGKPDITEVVLNVLIFIPFGVYLGTLYKMGSFLRKPVLVLGLSFILEITQFALAIGTFDITDLINNTLGGLLGIWLYDLLKKWLASEAKAQKVVNSLFLTGTLLLLGTLLYLKINHLLMFRN